MATIERTDCTAMSAEANRYAQSPVQWGPAQPHSRGGPELDQFQLWEHAVTMTPHLATEAKCGPPALKSETYPLLQATSFEFAARCYTILLTAVIDEFGLSKADPGIKRHLDYARKVPWTDTDKQVDALRRTLLD
jgi:hypothetical protein